MLKTIVKSMMIILVIFLAPFAYTQEREQKLVSTDWLLKNLFGKDIRVIDVRNSIRDYWAEHMPGAVYLNIDAPRRPDKGIPVKLIRLEALVKLPGETGIGRGTTVIACSEKNDYKATYLIWALDYNIWHKHSAVLNGGFSKQSNLDHDLVNAYI